MTMAAATILNAVDRPAMSALDAPNTFEGIPAAPALRLTSSERETADHATVSAGDLRELMRAVNETTERLHATHVSLQNQVARLQQELAEANAALRRSQALAALGEMAAGIAHEVRNPLGSIQLYVQMLAEDVADKPAQAELCGKISRAVVGLDAIVRDVLAFSRDTTIETQPTTTQELFDRALANCQSLVANRVQVIRSNAESCHHLRVDAGLITQALSNIIRNAVEAMTEHNSSTRQLMLSSNRGNVRCPTGKTELRVTLTVQDTGPGIPPEVQDRMFNPFFTTRATGTGLGLAIVHRIIDAHGGHIRVHTLPPPAGGARVELYLPVKPNGSTPVRIGKSSENYVVREALPRG